MNPADRPRESVWDYPRPPRVEPSARRVRIQFGDQLILDTTDAVRVLETSHPPTYYVPVSAFTPGVLVDGKGSSFCEYKGIARYHDLVTPQRTERRVGWSYDRPTSGYGLLVGRVAIYPGRVDAAWIDDELVQAQPGGFYGGWVTSELDGPFKGAPGTAGW